MNKLMLTFVALGVFVAASGFKGGCGGRPPAQGSGCASGEMTPERASQIVADLDLTDAQKASIQAVKDRVRAEARSQMADARADREALVKAVLADSPDAEAAHPQLDVVLARGTAMSHRLLDAALEVSAILTPEQRAELRAVVEEQTSCR